MKSIKVKDGYLLRLNRGELLARSVLDFVHEQGVHAAWVQGVGGVEWVQLGFYHLDQQKYQWKKFDKLLEVASLQGNISWLDSEPVLHMHGVFSDEHFYSFAGHVKEAAVAATCEIYIHVLSGTKLTRQHDNEVGLNLLDFS